MSASVQLRVLLNPKCILFELTPNIFLNYLLLLWKNDHELFVAYIGFVNSLLLPKILTDCSLATFIFFENFIFSKEDFSLFFRSIIKQFIIYQKFRENKNFSQILNDIYKHNLFQIKRVKACFFQNSIFKRNLHYQEFSVSIFVSPINHVYNNINKISNFSASTWNVS